MNNEVEDHMLEAHERRINNHSENGALALFVVGL